MSLAPATSEIPIASENAWKLSWLTPMRCRMLLVALIMFGAVSHVLYLHSPEALELAPDEAQYWVWSKHIDWSYYSKGPMVALIIRGSTALFGDTMPAVRYPAILIGVLMTLMTYWLTRKLFNSDRLALGSVALTHFVPMYIAGSLIMTIDPPYVLFWAAATCFYFKAILDNAKWAWLLVGAMLGLSFLAKYFAPVLYVGIVLGLLLDSKYRRQLAAPWPYLGVLIFAALTFPVVYWNARNGWVSAHHVGSDIDSGFNPVQPVQFLLGQVALVGPFLCIILAAALWRALRFHVDGLFVNRWRAFRFESISEPVRRARLLVLTSLPVVVIVFIDSFKTNVQLNWTAPVFFAWLIAGAWFLSTRLENVVSWRRWRGLVWGTAGFGLAIMPLAHHLQYYYPAIAWFQTNVLHRHVRVREDEVAYHNASEEDRKRNFTSVRKFDPTARLAGWRGLAEDVDAQRKEKLGDDAFVMVDDYSEAAALEFYGPGHPKTYIMGAFIEDPAHRGRMSQWDMWPDRSLARDSTTLIGKNAVYLGKDWPIVSKSFERVERLSTHEIYIRSHGTDYHIGGYAVWGCYGFKGFVPPRDTVKVW